jgi:DNA-nicking Smr family endonuclease
MAGPPPGPEPDRDPVPIPIEDALDLHAFLPQEIPDVVADYLAECVRLGLREVRLIHGRGTGTQRLRVQSLLARHPSVETFADAPPERGGWGATVVWLRSRSS